MANGQWPMVNGQWSMANGQWPIANVKLQRSSSPDEWGLGCQVSVETQAVITAERPCQGLLLVDSQPITE
jgi:hypothetical protein